MVPADRPTVEVRDLRADELDLAVALLARGFRDNPIPTAAIGGDPERRRRCLEAAFGAMFRLSPQQRPLVALDGGAIVGVTGVAPPGTCRASIGQQAKVIPSMLPFGIATVARFAWWSRTWAKVDPDERHSHLGPFAVDVHLRGRGIGSQILSQYCQRLDDASLTGYLETETEANVRLYERFGFTVIGERSVIGVDNWFMRRPAGRA